MKYVIQNGRAVALPTLPVTNCDGCGACCRHMGTPPGYAAYYPRRGPVPGWALRSPDYERWRNLPLAVEAELRAYYDAVKAGVLDDRTRHYPDAGAVLAAAKAGRLELAAAELAKATPGSAIPCLWYDAPSGRCRHYEHRPQTCRDAILPGDDACLATRRAFRVPLPMAPKGGKNHEA
jgi:Fe-S-cluster containining protein